MKKALFSEKMRKRLFIICLVVFATAGATQAQQWKELHTGVTEDLYDVCCIDTNIVFVCGQNGVILKTEDGGGSWHENFRKEGNNLYDLCFVNDAIGFAYGDILVKTTDGGNTWLQMDTHYQVGQNALFEKDDGLYYNITRMNAIDADTLYFISNLGWLSKSTDGGATASYVFQDYAFYLPETENSCRLFFEDNIGYVVYLSEEVVVYKTNDYGNSWERVFEMVDGPFQNQTLVHFLNKDEVKLYCEPVTEFYLYWDNVICTNDGFISTTMEKSYTDFWVPTYFRDSKFTSPENGCYIAKTGMYGEGYCYAAITNDGGIHWKYCVEGLDDELNVNEVDGFDDVYYLAAEKGYVYRTGQGTAQINESSEFNTSIYPNPANYLIEICGENISVVELYSAFGTCFQKKQGITDKTFIDIHDFVSGIYYVRIIDKQGKSVTKKLIKE